MGKIKFYYEEVVKFLKSVKSELKRVTWPTKAELRASTIVVLVILVLITGYLWVTENIFLQIFKLLGKS